MNNLKIAFLSTIVACFSLVSCKKTQQTEVQTTLNASFYIKDYKGISQPAKINYYLIRPENKNDLKSAATVDDSCSRHSIIAFTGTGYNYKNNVPPGEFILVAQVSVFEKGYNWYRYSYKNLTINKGDHLNEVMVFNYEGLASTYQPWNSDK